MNIEATTNPAADDLATVAAGMRRFEVSVLPGLPDPSQDVLVAAFARDAQGLVRGGIKANVYRDGLEIGVLWVEEPYRHQGIARSLMGRVECFARDNGAVIAFLKTVEAKAFYERLGYEVFGTLEDRPIGTLLYHMKKRLDADDYSTHPR